MRTTIRGRTWIAERFKLGGILVFVLRVWVRDRHPEFELRTNWFKIASVRHPRGRL